ncbi:hypothetical protein [Paenibacillus thalictri]|uniref:hypothetical protein n=1 Tax=Paenibacillus thalictri TaxID=2527873 RepID=UPI0013EF0691|nr:hypothetical protein [Paenibacillus thalictri]
MRRICGSDPIHQTIEVYGLEHGAYRKRDVFGKDGRLTSFVFPGFDIELSGVFK